MRSTARRGAPLSHKVVEEAMLPGYYEQYQVSFSFGIKKDVFFLFWASSVGSVWIFIAIFGQENKLEFRKGALARVGVTHGFHFLKRSRLGISHQEDANCSRKTTGRLHGRSRSLKMGKYEITYGIC